MTSLVDGQPVLTIVIGRGMIIPGVEPDLLGRRLVTITNLPISGTDIPDDIARRTVYYEIQCAVPFSDIPLGEVGNNIAGVEYARIYTGHHLTVRSERYDAAREGFMATLRSIYARRSQGTS